MNEEAFVERRESSWTRLSQLCDRCEFTPTALEPQEVKEFVDLYRKISADLAWARTKSDNVALIEFLNDLVGRAYGVLYRSKKRSIWDAVLGAIELSAQVVRKRFNFVLISFMLFWGAAILSAFGVSAVPDLRDPLIPPAMDAAFEHWRTGEFSEKSAEEGIFSTAFYATNNPYVSLVVGTVGAGTLGIASVYMILQNGAMLGLLLHEVAPYGREGYVLVSIFPHGVPELSGIFVSGAAGILLGWTMIRPGRRSRAQALQEVGKDVLVLLVTSISLMFIAAPIEGFFSFNAAVPTEAKIIFGGIEVVAWTLFWTFVGRRSGLERETGNALPK
jgi:uncharacterized membrane protein SpoIIM required for sporulation